jgi:hypothetical protein
VAFAVGDDDGFAALHDGHAGVGLKAWQRHVQKLNSGT